MTDLGTPFETGPDATRRAAANAWARVDGARAVIVVEGVTDLIAVETTARMLGRDLVGDDTVVLPINGAQAIGRTLPELLRRVPGARVGGLCDAAEQPYFWRAVTASGLGEVDDRAGLERLGFHVCVDDLEDELARAAGRDLVEQTIAAEGEQSAFATLRAQPPWREATFERQVRRFIGSRAGRKHRYAAAFVEALGADRAVRPLAAAIEHVSR